ncbi:MAG TPA: M20/M25/M40 family metallo-hydrolase, partial [Gemmatimonadaceae bacterium]
MNRTFRRCVLTIAMLVPTAGFAQESVNRYVHDNEHRILSEFVQMLSIPNVASDSIGIARNVAFITNAMEKRGLSPRLLRARDAHAPPLIYGEWKSPAAKRTIVFYAHYDGQPTDPAKWNGSKPWEPVIRSAALERGGTILTMPASGQKIDPEWRVYARSASDDKAGVMAFLAAIDALRSSKLSPTVNIKL